MHAKIILSVVLSLALLCFLDAETSRASKASEPLPSSICQPPGYPRWTFDQSHIFPHDQPLARPEDGESFPDGRQTPHILW